jgi:hypothetical protein
MKSYQNALVRLKNEIKKKKEKKKKGKTASFLWDLTKSSSSSVFFPCNPSSQAMPLFLVLSKYKSKSPLLKSDWFSSHFSP